MEFVNLGSTGLKVSRICLGTMTYGDPNWREWTLPEDEGRPFIQRALELGINFFDTADTYSRGVSEEIVGRALKDFARREEVVVATKVYFPMGDDPNNRGLSRKHIMDGIDASLKRLGMDYVDLYQTHRWDYATPIEETVEALHDVVKAGKARYVGASSMYAWQFAQAVYTADLHGWTRFVSMQNHYNLIYREEEREMIPFCIDEGIGLLPWSPLARGVLVGTRTPAGEDKTVRARTDDYSKRLYAEDTAQADFEIIDHVNELASKHGKTPAQVALAWMLHKPHVDAPIIGASKMHHLEEAVDALGVELSEEDIRYLEEPYVPHPVSGHD